MTPLELTRIEKAAADCGFDLSPEIFDRAVVLRSTRFPEVIEVRLVGEMGFELRASSPLLLADTPGALLFQGYENLYAALEKAAATARTMPNRVAEQFKHVTSSLPKSTEAERLVVQRVGQDLFRKALLDYWQRKCCVTGLAVPELLRASHIQPWAECASDEARLDVFNGLLLSPNLDALFDGGWFTVMESGAILISAHLPREAQEAMGLDERLAVTGLQRQHFHYLAFHRQRVFRA